MRRIVASVVLLSLTACGGGGGGIGGNVGGSATPIQTGVGGQSYAVSLKVTGGAMGHLQDDIRSIRDTATPSPIQMMSPDSTDPLAGGGPYASGAIIQVQAQVSPAPSTIPAVTYSSMSSNIAIIVPTPDPSASPAIPVATIDTKTIGAAETGKAITADIGVPVSATDTRALIIYPGMTPYCVSGQPAPTNEYPGYSVSGGHITGVNDATQADIYMTYSNCPSNFNDPTPSDVLLHFPHGGALISNDAAFASVTTAQWSNTQTSVGYAQLGLRNADGSLNNIVVFKGADGTICKYMIVSYSGGQSVANGYTSGPVQCHGTSIDGF